MEAQAIWRLYPRQIASDLSRFHHRRIADWHQGTMSSYELLELIEFPAEEGALAQALRDGEMPPWQQMIRQVANETAVLRAGQVQGVNGEEYGSRLWIPDAVLREAIEHAREAEEGRHAVFASATRHRKEIGQ